MKRCTNSSVIKNNLIYSLSINRLTGEIKENNEFTKTVKNVNVFKKAQ